MNETVKATDQKNHQISEYSPGIVHNIMAKGKSTNKENKDIRPVITHG